ncbi:MAG: hypothetical protein AB4042_19320 [Leptolyngbyaceae cyanobacterium]
MDLILEQVAELNTKVDALYTMVNQLNQTVSSMAESFDHPTDGRGNDKGQSRDKDQGKTIQSSLVTSESPSVLSDQTLIGADFVLEHKDVLVESHYLESDHRRNDGISPELQTQRLTAQLTAAYNRIAALEEQLLSKRIQ